MRITEVTTFTSRQAFDKMTSRASQNLGVLLKTPSWKETPSKLNGVFSTYHRFYEVFLLSACNLRTFL